MANIYGDDTQFSAAPPAAPLAAALRRRGRGPIGRTSRQFHPGVLAKLHPDHPIFKVLPNLARFMQQDQQPPVPPTAPAPPVGGGPSSVVGQPGGPSSVVGQSPYPWMQNIPTDLSGLGAEQYGSPVNFPGPQRGFANQIHRKWSFGGGPGQAGPPGEIGGDVRAALLHRLHGAVPQQQPVTSRQAMKRHLGQQRRKMPMLPLRKPRAY